MIVYIAGPMSGIDNYNRPAFFAAARQLGQAGHVPINPATLPTTLADNTRRQNLYADLHQHDRRR